MCYGCNSLKQFKIEVREEANYAVKRFYYLEWEYTDSEIIFTGLILIFLFTKITDKSLNMEDI